MSKKTRLIASFVAALCSQCICAQIRVMGIEEMFRLADENSTSIQTYRTGREVTGEALRAAKAQRLPDIDISLSGSYWGDGKLWDRDFSNATAIDMPHWGNNFAIEARQIIYSGGAINSSIKLAELQSRAAELDWQKNRQDVRFLLTGYYLDLYKLGNQAQVLQKNIGLAEQDIADMKARYEQGTALKNDITRYELQREALKLQLTQVQDACKIAGHRLSTTLHLPKEVRITPDTTILDDMVQTLTENDWQQMAGNNNIDLQQARVGIDMNKQRLKMERSARLPQISLVAADHLDGPITIEVPVLDNNFNYWYVGIGVKYSISSLFKNSSKIRQARLSVRQSEEAHVLAQEQVENAVQDGYVNFMTAFTELNTQEKSVRLAGENYDVVSNRYRNGMALLTELLDAGNSKLDAELALVNARINIVYHYYKMKYLTHTL